MDAASRALTAGTAGLVGAVSTRQGGRTTKREPRPMRVSRSLACGPDCRGQRRPRCHPPGRGGHLPPDQRTGSPAPATVARGSQPATRPLQVAIDHAVGRTLPATVATRQRWDKYAWDLTMPSGPMDPRRGGTTAIPNGRPIYPVPWPMAAADRAPHPVRQDGPGAGRAGRRAGPGCGTGPARRVRARRYLDGRPRPTGRSRTVGWSVSRFRSGGRNRPGRSCPRRSCPRRSYPGRGRTVSSGPCCAGARVRRLSG
ncbi:hypothetical protein Ga0074812_1152 [Parafrankia irregularis]|uniref:Uncharacterized protein n=1 Tax=Parafrankia irregularis TaxID=795642 RepID=A0A0S4QRH2_9ACTN|nr:hypothetical protein Ga0074812_1152 [Parafrankia irregularis]